MILFFALKNFIEFSGGVTLVLALFTVSSAVVSLAVMQLWKTRVFDPLVDLDKLIRGDLVWNLSMRSEISGIAEISKLQHSFNELLRKIQESNEIKAEFLSTVSHELRTPLTAIGGYVKVLAAEEAGPINATQKEFLQIVDVNVSRLGKLINDILDVEKMESGKFEVSRDPLRLASILEDCRNTFDVMVREKGLRLEFKGLEKDLQVLGERDRLIQIFVNLISNAIKYTVKGGVSVSLESEGQIAVVRVQDTGPGITVEQKLELFHKFRRLRNDATRMEGGTGLGLFIAHGLVEAHNGAIEVQSEEGRGCAFIVRLPIFVPSSEKNIEGNRRRVLLFEQKRDLAVVIRGELERRKLAVDWVESIGALISKIEQSDSYDIAVLDGDESLKLLRKLPQGLTLPVCVLFDERPDNPSESDRILYIQKFQSFERLADQVLQFLEKSS